jgi:hypothetical protein
MPLAQSRELLSGTRSLGVLAELDRSPDERDNVRWRWVVRVYVSSTFEDLREHRAAAIRVLRQMGHDVVAMEEYVAESAIPLTKVMEDVASCDAYVGVFAWRYGFVPRKGPRIPGARPAKTSITEYEYRQAGLRGLEILIYLLHEQAPWPAAQIDGVRDPAQGEAVRKLRSQLQDERTVGYFSTPDGLAAQVGAGISALGLRADVKRRLMEPLSAGSVAGALGVLANQPVFLNDSYLMPLRQLLVDRASDRAASIDIGTTWWSTRLYLLASLGEVLGNLEAVVVFDSGKFVGVASTGWIRRALRSEHREADQFERTVLNKPPSGDVSRTVDRYINGWNRIMKAQGTPGRELAVMHPVTRANLTMWLGDAFATSRVIVEDVDALSAVDLLRILDYPRNLVPIGSQRHEQERATTSGEKPVKPHATIEPQEPVWLVDKGRIALQLARKSIQEMLDRLRIV